jgi:Ser/Thr protein kinase RdoA (MazF antagonist)
MTTNQSHDSALVPTHTTAASSSIAHWAAQHHGLQVQACHLIRRGLNDSYALRSTDGRPYVARLYSIRPRGEFNAQFEISLLAHLTAKGVDVAAPVLAADGRTHVILTFPEGPRALALFHHVEGAIPATLEEFELTGRTLAHIHIEARDYAGPPSRYTLDGHHLAGRTYNYLQAYPALGADLLDAYGGLIHRLLDELGEIEGGLTRVICHGDTHGFNNHISIHADGSKKAVFFDFDDAGPGFLAYDLSVLPWSYLFRKNLTAPDDILRERWTHYLQGYRAGGGEISDADLGALPLFLQLRHLWNLGEAVGRLHHWGTSMVPADWLEKQLKVFEAWKEWDARA